MNPRFVQLFVLLVGGVTLVLCGWVLLRGPTFFTGVPSGPSESFLLLFASKVMLKAFPGNLATVVRIYALAAAVASALALTLVLRPQQRQPALLLGVALSGVAFFAAHFVLSRHVPALVGWHLLVAFDYLGMVAFAYGLHAMVRIAMCYPQPIDHDAFLDYNQKQLSQKRLRTLAPTFTKFTPTFFREVTPAGLADRFGYATIARWQLSAIGSVWWWWGMALLGCGLVVCSQMVGPGSEDWLKLFGFFLLLGMAFPMFDLTITVLGWQYRLGDPAQRNQLVWVSSGVVLFAMICGASSMGAVLSAMDLSKTQGMAVLTALAPPITAIAILLFLGCSIFFFGAIDPRLALRKVSVYGIAGLLLAIGLSVAQGTAATQLVHRFGLPGNSGMVLAAAVAGLVFAPLRGRIEGAVERLVERVLPASSLAEAHRETATVVFGDMSGYTQLSAKNEAAALTLASLLHKESRRLAERHGGRLVKTIGDAVLLSFHDPGEAIITCTELRDAFAVASGALTLPMLQLHFGLNTGEVVRDQDGDIFGGTVNLAARLQGVANAGEIVVSGAVASGVANRNFTLQPLGEKALKNVPVPVACFLIA